MLHVPGEVGCFPSVNSYMNCSFNSSNPLSPCFSFPCMVVSGGAGRTPRAEDFAACDQFKSQYCLSLVAAGDVESDPGCFPMLAATRSTCDLHVDTASLRSPCHHHDCVEGSSAACVNYTNYYCSVVGSEVSACGLAQGECPFMPWVSSSPCQHRACVPGMKSNHSLATPTFMQVYFVGFACFCILFNTLFPTK